MPRIAYHTEKVVAATHGSATLTNTQAGMQKIDAVQAESP
jgi:hypothetical protein